MRYSHLFRNGLFYEGGQSDYSQEFGAQLWSVPVQFECLLDGRGAQLIDAEVVFRGWEAIKS